MGFNWRLRRVSFFIVCHDPYLMSSSTKNCYNFLEIECNLRCSCPANAGLPMNALNDDSVHFQPWSIYVKKTETKNQRLKFLNMQKSRCKVWSVSSILCHRLILWWEKYWSNGTTKVYPSKRAIINDTF